MINLYNIFEVSMLTHYEDTKGDEKCINWGGFEGYGFPTIIGSVTIPYSAYDFLFKFNRNYVCFRLIASYWLKVADFNLPHLRLMSPI